MNFLGIDYGEKRIGLAYGDSEVYVATPIPAAVQSTLKERMAHIEKYIKERRIHEIVIGYPYNMDGSVSAKALEVEEFIKKLEKFGLPIHKSDERLTSHQVEADLESYGVKKKRKTPKQRQQERKTGDVDSRAAALILQDHLESLNPGGHGAF